MIFDTKGAENTKQTLIMANKRAKELGIKELVVATTSGKTAKMAAELCPDMKITAVSYHAGCKKYFALSISEEDRNELEQLGIKVVCATHALSGVERGLSKKLPGNYPVLLVAQTLKLFGQGTKVAVEVSIMAADSGALSGKRIIAVGGSSKGADTALLMSPATQSDFFDIKIHETICKPGEF